MANNVVNVFTVYPSATVEIADELARIRVELSTSGALHLNRTVWAPTDEEPLRFVSAWGPDDHLHQLLTRRLAAADPTLVVENSYQEEFLQAVGVQLSRLENGAIKTVVVDRDLSSAWFAESVELERFEADLDRYKGDPERFETAFDDYIAAYRQCEEEREIFADTHLEECRLQAFALLSSENVGSGDGE